MECLCGILHDITSVITRYPYRLQNKQAPVKSLALPQGTQLAWTVFGSLAIWEVCELGPILEFNMNHMNPYVS